MTVVGFAAAIAEAVTTFSCRVGEFILGNPRSQNLPMSLFVPQSSTTLSRSICGPTRPPSLLPGLGIPFRGGQCINSFYNVTVRFRRSDGYTETTTQSFQGQFLGLMRNPDGRWGWFGAVRRPWNPGAIDYLPWLSPLDPFDWEGTVVSVTPGAGQPDNCGDLPPSVQPPLPPSTPYPQPDPTDPDRIWPNITIPVIYAPVSLSAPITINVNFGGFKLTADVKIPITIPVDIGGVKIGDVVFNPDSEPEYRPNPAPTGGDSPEPPECPDTTTLVVPFAIRESCSQSSAELEVLSDSLPPALIGRLIDTVNLALESCGEEPKPPQEPEVEIGSGTAPSPAGEQFVNVPDECVSVRLRITSPGAARQVTTYGTAGQRKYGSLGFAMLNMAGGGDYVYVYDSDTYYPLPPRGKPGRIRLLLAPGVGWELYDTGERL